MIDHFEKNLLNFFQLKGGCCVFRLADRSLVEIICFTDDNYAIKIDCDLTALKISMENTIVNISNWMRSSGLKVNKEKNEICA